MSMRRGYCIHFNGMQHESCAAGVIYVEAFGAAAGTACRAPCIQEYKTHTIENGKHVPTWKPWPRHDQPEMICPKRVMPTAEEIAAGDAELDAMLERMRVVMAVVKPWRTWTKKNRVAQYEVIACPACKGRLHLSQSRFNGHVWGKCETVGCVSWME